MADARTINSLSSNTTRGLSARELRQIEEREQRIQKRIFSRFDVPDSETSPTAPAVSSIQAETPARQVRDTVSLSSPDLAIDPVGDVSNGPVSIDAKTETGNQNTGAQSETARTLGQIIDVFA